MGESNITWGLKAVRLDPLCLILDACNTLGPQ